MVTLRRPAAEARGKGGGGGVARQRSVGLTVVAVVLSIAVMSPTAASSRGGTGTGREHGPDWKPAGNGMVATANLSGTSDVVEVELRGADDEIRAAVAESGGLVLGDAPGVVHARVPIGGASLLEHRPGVHSVTAAPVLHQHVTSDGVDSTGASAWHTAGTNGIGVDVAIIDAGFASYENKIAMDELPADTVTKFDSCADSELTDHGTYVAEVVHDMAPGATIHLICIDSAFDVDSSADPVMAYLRDNDIEIANASFGFNTLSRGDGQGAIDNAVTQSRRDGTLWTVAAGNEALMHSRLPKGSSTQRILDNDDGMPGLLVDAVDVNPGSGTDRWMSIVVGPGDGDDTTAEAGIEMKWDGWTDGGATDFDLWVFDHPQLFEGYYVDGSFGEQSEVSLPPVESLLLSNPSFGPTTYYLLVDAFQPASAAIDLYFSGDVEQIEYHVPAGSVTEPGTSPGAFTVGAACFNADTLEPFSSQGPTIDGRVKPDIIGPDGVDTSAMVIGTCDGFAGTSVSAAHVAGAAALVLDATPDLGPTEMQNVLEQRATAAGPAGKDNAWGWGRLALGPANAPGAPTGNLFSALSPSARLLDTRTASNPLASGATRQIQIVGTNGVPANADRGRAERGRGPAHCGWLPHRLPRGAARPVASSLNFAKGQVISNSVTVGLSPSGAISLFNYSGSTHVVVDIAGWYGPTGATGLQTVDPIRAVDTRPGKTTRIAVPGGDIGGTEVLNVRLAGNPAIPEVPATATAVVLNVAVTGPTITGHLTVWPDGVSKPLASNLNFNKGATVANLVVAKTGTDGRVNLATNGGKTHAIIDIVGYYDAAAPGRFVALPTVNRVLDTRTGTGGAKRPASANQARSVAISELYGVPGDATGVVLNVTAIAPQALTGHLRVWGTGPLPTASTLNFTRGAIIGNAALVGLGPSSALVDGFFGVYNSSNSPTDVVADVSGYFVEI